MASHEFIPPDVLETVVRKIADEFVTGGVSLEVLQAGYDPLIAPFNNIV
jgi:protein SDA1